MPENVENYVSPINTESLKKQAFRVWTIALIVVSVWVSLILLAPIAEYYGYLSISNPIYTFYSFLCHQIETRSFHIDSHPFAVCSRCFGVYLGLVVGFIVYPLLRSMEDIEPFPKKWLFLALVPMGIDWALGFFEIWENTHFSRFLTGLILGAACAIYLIPALVEIAQLSVKNRQKRLSF